MDNQYLRPGFTDPVQDSQRVFRRLLKAMSEPGTIAELDQVQAVEPVCSAALTTLLSLTDQTTRVWVGEDLRTEAVRQNLSFHSGVCWCDLPDQADFALATLNSLPPLSLLRKGEPDYPDRSCTLIVQLSRIAPSALDDSMQGLRLSGPGIADKASIYLSEIGAELISYLCQRPDSFPLGLDLIFVAGSSVCAIPRTTLVEEIV